MLERERRATITRLLESKRFLSVHDVVRSTGASQSTVRRDFADLESAGVAIRVRGGVEAVHASGTSTSPPLGRDVGGLGSFQRRSAVRLAEKRRIAERAAELLRSGDTIFVDGGTTTFQLAGHLSLMSLNVVTNSLALAHHLATQSQCTVTIPEGRVDTESLLILNTLTEDPFSNYSAARAFMGVEGITERGLTNNDPVLIQAERAMIRHAEELIVLADETKFGAIGTLSLAPIEQVTTIVTTRNAPEDIIDAVRARGVRVILA